MDFGLFFELSVPRPFTDGIELTVYERSLEPQVGQFMDGAPAAPARRGSLRPSP